ncbi:MAG: glycosyltransferase family 2 protein [bacterium]|nr:glycosyltransferase family 2 protein [bacterium]
MISLIFWLSLSILFFSYVIYPIIVVVIAKLFPKTRKINENLRPTVSMIVSAYNEEKNLPEKLENFRKLNYPSDKIELVIGSDASSDKTNEMLSNLKDKNIRAFIYQNRSGKSAVLNKLVKEANGAIFIFSDANTIYHKDAIIKLVRHFGDKNIGGVCGFLKLKNPNKNIGGIGEQFYWNFENILKSCEGKIKTVIGANGAIYALRKELFHPLPEDKVVMDDFLIPLKAVEMGYDVIYEGEALAEETTSPDLKGEYYRKIRIGAANFNALVEIKNLLRPSRGFVSVSLWFHKVFRWFAPFLFVATFLSNLFFALRGSYQLLFLLQLIFYGSAIAGYFFIKKKNSLKIFIYPYYFCAINLALAVGFYKFLTKTQKPAWGRIDRT